MLVDSIRGLIRSPFKPARVDLQMTGVFRGINGASVPRFCFIFSLAFGIAFVRSTAQFAFCFKRQLDSIQNEQDRFDSVFAAVCGRLDQSKSSAMRQRRRHQHCDERRTFGAFVSWQKGQRRQQHCDQRGQKVLPLSPSGTSRWMVVVIV